MSRLTTTVATLGMVAALGIAALPLSTYATEWTDDDCASTTSIGSGECGLTAAEGGNKWVSTDVPVQLKIDDILSIETSDTEVVLQPSEDEDIYTKALTVTVVTKNKSGYTLNIKGSGSNPTKLVDSSVSGFEIGPMEEGHTAPTATNKTEDAQGKSEWGYLTSGLDSANYQSVTGSDVKVGGATEATTFEGDDTSITFGVSIQDDLPAGTYKGQVTFTAVNNAA